MSLDLSGTRVANIDALKELKSLNNLAGTPIDTLAPLLGLPIEIVGYPKNLRRCLGERSIAISLEASDDDLFAPTFFPKRPAIRLLISPHDAVALSRGKPPDTIPTELGRAPLNKLWTNPSLEKVGRAEQLEISGPDNRLVKLSDFVAARPPHTFAGEFDSVGVVEQAIDMTSA